MLPRSTRIESLKGLKSAKDKAVGSEKLTYGAETFRHPVYRIDLDFLVYNRHNGRLESEMLTWQHEHSVGDGDNDYDDELHDLIGGFLWRDNVSRNKATFLSLEQRGQRRPGIVTLDGVIIDGNRRAMLLRRLEVEKKEKQYFEAVILPDEYSDNEKAIVRLETQYQMGEDAILDYGPLEKYLHVKRLRILDVDVDEIEQLMGKDESQIKTLISTMELMDDYLEHIGCEGLYTMLKESEGAIEDMFLKLEGDLKRFKGGSRQVDWAYDDEVDLLDLRTILFDHIRFGPSLSDQSKAYRKISNNGKGKKTFFAHEDIWKEFSETHRKNVDPVTEDIGSLDDYLSKNPIHLSKIDAAMARENEWKDKSAAAMKRNFGKNSEKLREKIEVIEPRELLERAYRSLGRIDVEGDGFLADKRNLDIVMEINRISFQMKKKFERAGRKG